MDPDTVVHKYSTRTHGTSKQQADWRCNVALRRSLRDAAAARDAGNAVVDDTGDVVQVYGTASVQLDPSATAFDALIEQMTLLGQEKKLTTVPCTGEEGPRVDEPGNGFKVTWFFFLINNYCKQKV